MPRVKTTSPNSSAEVEPKLHSPADGDEAAKEVLFFDRLKQISEAEWESQRTLRIYRRLPAINRPGRHYIEKVNCAIDEEYLLKKHGSGVYFLLLNDAKRTVDSATVQLYNPDHPPNVRLEELTDDPGNAPYLALLKRTPDESKGDEGSARAAVTALSGLLTKLVEQRQAGNPSEETERKLTNTLVSWALEQTGKDRQVATAQGDPTALAGLIRALKELAPPAPADPVVLLDRLFALSEKVRPPVAPESERTDGLGQLDQLLDVIGKLEERFGGRGRAIAGHASTTEIVVKALPEILREASALMGKTTEAARLAHSRVPIGPGISPGAQIPGPASPTPEEQRTAATVMPAPPPLETEPVGGSAPCAPTSADTIIKQAIVAHVLDGRDGEEMGTWLEMTAPALIEALEKIPAAKLKTWILGDTILKQLGDFAGLDKFLEEFGKFLHEPEEATA
jgi:hypothetical protein